MTILLSIIGGLIVVMLFVISIQLNRLSEFMYKGVQTIDNNGGSIQGALEQIEIRVLDVEMHLRRMK